MQQYLDLVKLILEKGRTHTDRTGVGRRSIIGHQMRFNLSEGFPLLTTKFTAIRPIIHELLWFLSGNTNIKYLKDNNVKIWDEWSLSQEALKMSPDERVAFLQKNNAEAYKRYLLDISWETGGYSADDIFAGLTVEDFNQTQELILDNIKVPAYLSSHFKEGDLGPVYPALWRRAPGNPNEVILIDKRNGPVPGPLDIGDVCKFNPLITDPSIANEIDTFWDNNGIPFNVIEKVSEKGAKNSRYLIQFVKSGFVREVDYRVMKNTTVFDPYHPSTFGVACMGRVSGIFSNRAYVLWRNMIVRCYDVGNSAYQFYGKKGIYVSPRWLCFENFLADISQLPNYEQWAFNSEQYDLDKDYYGSNCYDVSTCAFIKKDLNVLLSKEPRHMVATSPAGEARVFFSRKDLVESLDVSDETLRNYMNGRFKKSSLDGWKFEDFVPPPGKLLRPQLVIDQIGILVDNLRKNPFSSRHVVSCWIPNLLPAEGESHSKNVLSGKQALPACHTLFQFFVEELTNKERIDWIRQNKPDAAKIADDKLKKEVDAGNFPDILSDPLGVDAIIARNTELFSEIDAPRMRLSCQLYQRSADVFLGVPFNIASYALLTMMIAQCVDMVPGDFIHTLGDAHLYVNHLDQVNTMLKQQSFSLPTMKLNPVITNIDDFTYGDFTLEGYQHGGKISAPVAV